MRPSAFLNPMSLLCVWLLTLSIGGNALPLPNEQALRSFSGYSDSPITSYVRAIHFTRSWSPDDVWQSVSQQVLDYGEGQLNSSAVQSAVQQINDFKTKISQVVSYTSDFQNEVKQVILNNNLTMDQLSDDVDLLFNETLTQLQEMFPDPDTAESHDKRTEMVSATFDMISDQLVEFLTNLGIPQSEVEDFIGFVRPPLEATIVLCGDLVQQHPQLFEALAFIAIGLAIPESWFLRPLLSLFGFGPSGPIKGSAAAWAQSRFFGPTIPKNSWFSLLQSLGSTVMCCGRRK